MPFRFFICIISSAFLISCSNRHDPRIPSKESLGEKLFNDVSLSREGTQACASCHDASHAFIDARVNLTSSTSTSVGGVSTGQDKISLGDINAPSIAYAAFVPDFHFDKAEGLYKGGLFLNGRALNLLEQAKQPFLNPLEMQTTKEKLVAKVKENYRVPFEYIYGGDVFKSVDGAFTAIADSIAHFEKTTFFSSFDSKFDKVLEGSEAFSKQEKLGKTLFEDEKKGNCAACHPVPLRSTSKQDSLFTDFSYDNIGAPKNSLVRSLNGKSSQFVDEGLFNNPKVNDPALKGAFRVSSLRNIAVTGPYMHNGVFNNLETVVKFYNTRDVPGSLNPETNKPWRAAEIKSTKNTEELGDLGLTDQEVGAIVAFLRTLTDQRYESLIKQ